MAARGQELRRGVARRGLVDSAVDLRLVGEDPLSAPGMGDVLTGIMAALAARLAPWEALRRSAWLHGQAAEDAVQEIGGAEGLTASELVGYVRRRLNACAA